jgi:hypothetical protein
MKTVSNPVNILQKHKCGANYLKQKSIAYCSLYKVIESTVPHLYDLCFIVEQESTLNPPKSTASDFFKMCN